MRRKAIPLSLIGEAVDILLRYETVSFDGCRSRFLRGMYVALFTISLF